MDTTIKFLEPQTDYIALEGEAITEQISAAEAIAREVYDQIAYLINNTAALSTNEFEAYTPGEQLTTLSTELLPYVESPSLDIGEPDFIGEIPVIPDLSLTLRTMPEPWFTAPSFDVPAPPSINWPEFSTSPPSAGAVGLPTVPSVALPDPPAITDIAVPAPPSISVPQFEGARPDIDLTPPSIDFQWSESAYTSALMSDIKACLEDNVQSGGAGLGANIEQAIYDRALAELQAEEEKIYQDAMEDAEARGFMLPPGALVGKVIDISDAINKKRAQINAEIIKEQTEIAQTNTHIAWDAAVKVETTLLQHHSRMQRRGFDAAKFVLDSAVALYRTKIDAYRAKVQVFAVLAKVYDAKIRAEIVKAELYKAQIEGARAGVEADEAKVEAYRAQLLGIAALVEMYKAEMQIGHVIAQIEKTRVEGYLAQVETYKARVEAVQAEYKGYIAQVRGEVAKAEMLKAQAQAYRARVNAYRTGAEVELEEARATVEALRAQVAIYGAQVQKFDEDVRYVISTRKAFFDYDHVMAELDILKARYNAAVRDLEASIFNARTTEASAVHQANATIADAQQSARATMAEAAAEGTRAAYEAATMLKVAANSRDTTSVSTNMRDSMSRSASEITSKDSDHNRSDSVHVGYYTYYHHK